MKTRSNRSDLSMEEQEAVRQELLSRKIYRFYEVLSKWAPIPLMLGHWYGVWDYGHYPRPVILDTQDNGNCIIWLYVLAYVYMPIAMLPVSHFFHHCTFMRIPFFYFFGINIIRLYYGSWLIRPNQLSAHYILIGLTLIAYIVYGIKIACQSTKCFANVGE